jgi:quercetin dioxygenase-like cupin family protein
MLTYTRKVSSSLHYHPLKHETFVVLWGRFQVQIPGETKSLNPGDSLIIPPNTPHRVRCLEEGTILESSSHDDPADCVRLLPSDT